MDVDLINGLLQTGAIGVLAYLLIQQIREQAQEHREELKALILQVSAGQERVSKDNEKAMSRVLGETTEVIRRNTEALSALTGIVHSTNAQVSRVEIRLAALKEELAVAPARRRKGATVKENPLVESSEVNNV